MLSKNSFLKLLFSSKITSENKIVYFSDILIKKNNEYFFIRNCELKFSDGKNKYHLIAEDGKTLEHVLVNVKSSVEEIIKPQNGLYVPIKIKFSDNVERNSVIYMTTDTEYFIKVFIDDNLFSDFVEDSFVKFLIGDCNSGIEEDSLPFKYLFYKNAEFIFQINIGDLKNEKIVEYLNEKVKHSNELRNFKSIVEGIIHEF